MRVKVLLITLAISLFSTLSSYAAWMNDGVGWYWEYAPGSRYRGCWQWLDGNNDGTAECYYFYDSGYMAADTTTPDGYDVNSSGAWIVNGHIQTRRVKHYNCDRRHQRKHRSKLTDIYAPLTPYGEWRHKK